MAGSFIDEYNALSARVVGLYNVAQSVGATASLPSDLNTYNLSNFIGSIPGYKHFSDYVQDGLILGWDGIENAGVGTHVHTLSSVYDHSGNGYSGTTLSAEIFNNGFHLNGPAARIYNDSSDKVLSALTNMEMTVEVVFSRMEWNNDQRYTIWSTSTQNAWNASARTYPNGNQTPYSANWKQTYNTVPEGARIQIGNSSQMMTLTIVGQPRAISYYANGTFVSTTTLDNDTPNGNLNPTFRIGGAGGSGTIPMVNMNFYCARVYNRILTQAEIAHNRAVDVARFNIQNQLSAI